MSFTKYFPSTTPLAEILREADFQSQAADIGLSPRVLNYTSRSIEMEKIDALCIADQYGACIHDIPEWIREEIVEILYALYVTLGIEYIDITPYNFIEQDGKVWIIDFGHATTASDHIHPFLNEIFDTWTLTKWNSDFA